MHLPDSFTDKSLRTRQLYESERKATEAAYRHPLVEEILETPGYSRYHITSLNLPGLGQENTVIKVLGLRPEVLGAVLSPHSKEWMVDIGDGYTEESFVTAHSLAPRFDLTDEGPYRFSYTFIQGLCGGLWPQSRGKKPTVVAGSVCELLILRRGCFLAGVDFEPIWGGDLTYDWILELIEIQRAASVEEIRTRNYLYEYLNFGVIICLRPDMFPFPPDISGRLLKQYLRFYLEVLEDSDSCCGELPISIGILNLMGIERNRVGENLALMVDRMFCHMA